MKSKSSKFLVAHILILIVSIVLEEDKQQLMSAGIIIDDVTVFETGVS